MLVQDATETSKYEIIMILEIVREVFMCNYLFINSIKTILYIGIVAIVRLNNIDIIFMNPCINTFI